ncbi:hypothetical protein BGZ57DRAFT_857845 [Hyaloscypha finlandica]|nr:hypothetical protein BGZ57DRAFT_857845 [Hyaloscypha finlandica]
MSIILGRNSLDTNNLNKVVKARDKWPRERRDIYNTKGTNADDSLEYDDNSNTSSSSPKYNDDILFDSNDDETTNKDSLSNEGTDESTGRDSSYSSDGTDIAII